MVIDTGVHTLNINRGSVERTDGAYTGEGRPELLKDGRLRGGFETFDFACSCKVAKTKVSAYNEQDKRKQNNIPRDEQARAVSVSSSISYSAWDLPCHYNANQLEDIDCSMRHITGHA